MDQNGRAVVPVGSTASRWALYGSLISIDAMLIFLLTSIGTSHLAILLGIGYGVVAGAVIPGLAALSIESNRVSMGPVERKLGRALLMVERGLIDQEEYRRLKARILETYHPGPISPGRMLPVVALGGLLGVAIVLSIVIGDSLGLTAIAAPATAAGIAGGAASASIPLGIEVIRRRIQRTQLPVPENRRLLGR